MVLFSSYFQDADSLSMGSVFKAIRKEEVEIFQISLSPNSAVDREWEFEHRRKRIKIE
jgi:hypothetical protein